MAGTSRPIKRLQFDKNVIDVLQRNGIITCKQLISRNHFELMKITNASFKTVQDIFGLASKSCCPQPTTALDLWRLRQGYTRYLSTSLPALDRFLKGGLSAGTVTEIAGPSGCGKTQMCLMLGVIAASPKQHGGMGRGVIYIDTESAFSAERLFEMAQMRLSDYYSDEDKLILLGRMVHVSVVTTAASLLSKLQNLEEELIRKNVGFVVVDSIASLIRKEFDTQVRGNMIERTNLLTKQAAILKYLAETLQIPVCSFTTHKEGMGKW